MPLSIQYKQYSINKVAVYNEKKSGQEIILITGSSLNHHRSLYLGFTVYKHNTKWVFIYKKVLTLCTLQKNVFHLLSYIFVAFDAFVVSKNR